MLRSDHERPFDATRGLRIDFAGQRAAAITEPPSGQGRFRRARVRRPGAPQRAGCLEQVTFHKLTNSSSRVTVHFDWEPVRRFEKARSLVGVGSHAVKTDLKNKQFIEGQGVDRSLAR